VLSAKTISALEVTTTNLVNHLKKQRRLNLRDVAYTLQKGRKAFQHRRAVVCRDVADAVVALERKESPRVLTALQSTPPPETVFMFPGQGSQHVNMGVSLYETEPSFRRRIDDCAEMLEPTLGFDLRDVLYPTPEHAEKAAKWLKQTAVSQPALFVTEYALAMLFMDWGVKPAAMLGHSLGEYVSACLAGVFSLEDTLKLVAFRGQLVQTLPGGLMIAVSLPEKELGTLLEGELSLAAVNGPSLCVASGPNAAVENLERTLKDKRVATRRLNSSHAFHSGVMEPIMEAFFRRVKSVELSCPKIPYLSNVTGSWIKAKEAMDPAYWVEHLRRTVRFDEALCELLKGPNQILLEVGPGGTLASLAKSHPQQRKEQLVLATLPNAQEKQDDAELVLNALAQLWLRGAQIDWGNFYSSQKPHRVPLPTYPFDRKRYWIEARREATDLGPEQIFQKREAIDNWFYKPIWNSTTLSVSDKSDSLLTGRSSWLIFVDDHGIGNQIVAQLHSAGQSVVTVRADDHFTEVNDSVYTVNPRTTEDYDALVARLRAKERTPTAICHLWSLNFKNFRPEDDVISQTEDLGFHSLVELSRVLGKHGISRDVEILVITDRMQVTGDELAYHPEQAIVLGPCRVIPKEYPGIRCRSIDISLGDSETLDAIETEKLFREIVSRSADMVVAIRGTRRWVQTFERVILETRQGIGTRLRQGGVYLITGGLGGVGMILADYLATTAHAKLVLTSRSAFPPAEEWNRLASDNSDEHISSKIRKLVALRDRGLEILILKADVTNWRQMETVVGEVKERYGHIDGVIHAAGVADGAVIHGRPREMSERVLAPKIKGTLIIDKLLEGSNVDFMVLCSSLTAIVGLPGQVAYCAANAFLDSFAQVKSRQPGPLIISINWDGWKNVGMMARSGSQFPVTLDQTPELGAGPRPLLDWRTLSDLDREIYVSCFNIKKHWVLEEHRILGKAVLPGTAYLEMAREAFSRHAAGGAIEIRDVYFQIPLIIGDNEEKEIQTVLTRRGEMFEFSIRTQVGTSPGHWQVHAQGKIGGAKTAKTHSPPEVGITDVLNECAPDIARKHVNKESPHIKFGPRWDSVKQIRIAKDSGVAILELPEPFLDDLDLYSLHPALLDRATSFLVEESEDGHAYLPFYYKLLTIHGPLRPRMYSRALVLRGDRSRAETLKFNFVITDDQGKLLVTIEECTMRKVPTTINVQTQSVPTETDSLEPTGNDNFSLEISSPGQLETLRFASAPKPIPGPGEVLIEVQASGLNFRDVLLALGALPLSKNGRFRFGYECAGRIVAVGENVTGYNIGDEVMALGASCFSRFIVSPALAVAPKPQHLNAEEAATIPVAFITAYYTLMKLGKLRRDHRVLIHAATGGVGLAAVKIAQWVGANIFATAGNQEKRDYLSSIGIQHIFDSRSLAFADELMERTRGAGVDVILNSLGGEFISKSLSVLAPFGHFLEIGVRDIFLNTRIGLRLFEKGLSFSTFLLKPDLPGDFAHAWEELMQHFEDRHFEPLPRKVFPGGNPIDAFKYMAQAKHIGKIILNFQDNNFQATVGRSFKAASDLEGHRRPTMSTALAPVVSPGISSDQETRALNGENEENTLGEYLSENEGIEVFRRILAGQLPQVVVSTQDLCSRMKWNHQAISSTNVGSPANLPGLKHSRPVLDTPFVAPRNGVEQKLAQIWQELLGIDAVGVHDNFFQLGGQSLVAIQAVARISDIYHIDLSVDMMFQEVTVAKLAEHIKSVANIKK
jgi:acyl transferase domain-containing protein